MNEFLINVVTPYEISIELFDLLNIKSIVNVGSMYGVVAANKALYKNYPNETFINYGVSKAGVMHLTKELAVRFSNRGVRVNCVALGGVAGRANHDFIEAYSRLTPSGKMLNVGEVVGPIDFLLSDASSSMTGQTIVCDGGWTVW
jgi:NAD(P)-dependent dehydrogenase (short-subunit alcohol dehydrogenase family)